MKKMALFNPVLVLLALIGLCGAATAGEPTECIRRTTDRILVVVSNPELKSLARAAERRRLIREAVDERFDWEEMSRRTLATHWARRSAEERKEFVGLFGDLLERTYLDKVEGYSGEQVLYESERVEGSYALVSVRIKTQQATEIPVLYKLKQGGADWQVYDISIEGVSLISNYRTQFNNIIVRSSYDELLKRLRAKQETN